MKLNDLRELAKLYSIQLSYEDAAGKRQTASRDSLVAALRARIGDEDLDAAFRARKAELESRLIEPVLVFWGRKWQELPLHTTEASVSYQLTLETGETSEGRLTVTNGKAALPHQLPYGYHRVRIDGRHEALILVSPEKAYAPTANTWGIFAPLYAVRTGRTWGVGDLTDLQAYRAWVNELGGGVVATLPMLASYLDEDPSPYSPVSRLYWNELYLDVTRLPEYRGDALEPLPLAGAVDYKRIAAAKRRLLEQLLERFQPDEDYERFARDANDYAAFRAMREGNDDARRYHLYVQYRMAQQMRETADGARREGQGLYLDFPLGVNPNGFDAAKFSDHFAKGMSVGAPPDLFFTKGQNWGFPPLDPDAARARQHAYFRASIRNHMTHAGILRIDHHMGLHRLFWIPEGAEAKHGVYIRYPEDELYAILLIESNREKCVLVGEDLGTVPEYVPRMMNKHGIRRMYVVQYEIKPEGDAPAGRPPRESVASINTHDMPTFAGFWEAKDVDDRIEQGLLDERGAKKERQTRAAMRERFTSFLKARGLLGGDADDELSILDAILGFLSESEAEIVLVNLEDLWLEREPQNVPGVPDKSWRRRFRLDLDAARADESVTRLLRHVQQRRRQGNGTTT